MNYSGSNSFLPSIKRKISEGLTKPSLLRKTTLQKLRYPIISNPKCKQNHQSAMLQSCITNKRYEDIMDAKNEDRIAKNMETSQTGSNKLIEPVTTYIGKEAALRYYEKYKSLDRTLQKRDLNQVPISPEINIENPVVSLLQKTQDLKLLPLCMGFVKTKGDICVLNVSDYNLGDRYMIALAAGIKKARTLEKLYLGGNRMTDLSLAQIAGSISQQVTVLELSRNKITVMDNKILQMIIEPHYRLECLGLANNFLKVSSADAIFRNAKYSKHLRRIDLRHNKLGVGCADSLIQLLQKVTSIEELYIGGNYLSGRCGQKVFNKIAQNKTLRVFDYSFNQLGDETSLKVAQAISNCLQSNRNLEHLDLTFNKFNREASDIIATGLETNNTLYGIHFIGNYGFINSRGFLILEQRQGTVLHSVDSFRMDGYQITSPREHNSFESHLYRDVCWICQGWYEQEFRLTLPKCEEGIFVYIHFDFQKYEPRLISLTETVKYVTMVPPKKYRYFFTVNNQTVFDPNANKQKLGMLEAHTYEISHQPKSFSVECVNYRKGKAKKIVNQWNEIIIKTLPRHSGLSIKKKKEPWQFEKSVWAKEWKLQNQEMLKKCFEKDWKCSKLTSLIKSQVDQDKVKDILWGAYSDIKSLYKYFSSWNPFGDIWAVSSNPFTQFCQQSKIISKDTPLKIIDLTFITTNSMSGPNYKGNMLVPERGLVRFQFMQSLVRLAEQKFKKLGVTDNFADATSMILKEHVIPLAKSYNLQSWRSEKYFNQFNDALIKKFRVVFSNIYKKNSKLKVRPGQKPFMCLAEFKGILDRIGLNTTLTERQVYVAFNSGMMAQVDELQTERFMKMTEIQFIEGLARCAYSLPSSFTIQETDQALLHFKLEWIVKQLRAMCSEEVKAQVSQMEESMFRKDEDQSQ